MYYFALLALKGIYHYWKYVVVSPVVQNHKWKYEEIYLDQAHLPALQTGVQANRREASLEMQPTCPSAQVIADLRSRFKAGSEMSCDVWRLKKHGREGCQFVFCLFYIGFFKESKSIGGCPFVWVSVMGNSRQATRFVLSC